MSSSSKRKAGAPSTERSAKVSRTALDLEHLNSQISMAALFRANKLVHDLKESQLRTILVQAYVSHPEIAHVVDLEHAKINETPSGQDAEPDPAPDSASDSESDHVASDHARKGSDNDMSESEDEMSKRNRKVTELKQRGILEYFSCSCKGGCANGQCECSKNSFSCGPDCKCTSCANYLNRLALFFGEQRLRATNCFASWMKAQGPDLDLDSAYTQEELRSTIMGVDEKKYYDKPEGSIFYDGSDEEIQELGKTWLKAKTEAERKPIRMALFKKAFLEDGVHFFSFCSGAWEESRSTDHCPICDECNDWRDWHCIDCGKCQFGISMPCEGCDGVSNGYHDQLECL
ncbi:cce0648c-b097-42e2-b6e1-e502cac62b8c [Sclerotinia trifoliorum]|uniref:Cce0648c-b097-42e2-b6e1-e502cac62b8c n=1 Tax=Sclerotinia trifoliorum TaxID=28548 RepID=A0A8H2ZQG9_9HELO|nr:cce0648c-b097-42e2-b6e1-e502cac62b8c [Sclerotinia trifoliorum]